MTEEKKKGLYGITPKAEVAYAWLDRAQDGYKGGRPKFSVTLRAEEEDADIHAWLQAIKKITGDKTLPVKRDKDDTLLVKFHSFKQPAVVDTRNQKLPDDISVGRNSIVRVAYGLSEYEGLGGGWTFYLNSVQVIKLVAFSTNRIEFPTKENGYVVGDDYEEKKDEAVAEQELVDNRPF